METFTTTIALPSLDATKALGVNLAKILKSGDVLTFTGPLGAGKTTLARAIIETATGISDVASPTFGLVQTYEGRNGDFYHFDFYRLESPEEVWELGIEEALEDGITLIEWPDKAPAIIPENALMLCLSIDGETRHAIFECDQFWRTRLRDADITE